MAYVLRRHVDDRFDDSDVAGPLLQIGRGGTADLLLDDDAVALEHAHINQEDERYVLIDQNSITGTYVNGNRIQTVILSDGDHITIGPFSLQVRISGPGEPLSLEINRETPAVGAGPGRLEAQTIDYAAAYVLNQKFLNKTLLTLLLVLGGGTFLGGLLWAGKVIVFQPGSVSPAHALFTNQCGRCHVPWHGPSEHACQECHAGPVHQKLQVFTPPCFACHSEHRDQQTLAMIADQLCVQCHADLKTKAGKPSRFENKVTDFTLDHPEFAITVKAGSDQKRLRLNDKGIHQSDLAKIKFTHELHLKPRLKSPKGPVQLGCKDCHVPAADGLLMEPVTYQAHCNECHKLGFDPKFPQRQVPHTTPDIVDAYLVRAYAELEDEIALFPKRARRLPGRRSATELSPSIIQKVREAETNLFEVTCRECHQIDIENRPLPRIEKPEIPVVWFQHARFSHRAHRMLGCASCHVEVSKSTKTTDVLLPGIQTCQNCHRKVRHTMLFQKARAPTDCAACHTYHDKSEDRDWDGPFSVKGLLNEIQTKTQPVLRQESSFWRYLMVFGVQLGEDNKE